MFVDDVASAVTALLRAGAAVAYGESINVASEALTFEDFVSRERERARRERESESEREREKKKVYPCKALPLRTSREYLDTHLSIE